jgi:3-methyladenine DNA glycosylase AlkD
MALTIAQLKRVYGAHADPSAAAPMRAYMRDQFPFLGLQRKKRDELDKELIGDADPAALARGCFRLPEREYQYFATKYLRKHVRELDASFIDVLEELITTKSWWDTVDELAVNVVGPLVEKHPPLVTRMDRWAKSEDLWLARSAILHQNKYRARTDAKRLFRYCAARAADKDFFMRKAIGWALREYSATEPEAVRAFVDKTKLSPLSAKEALRKI